MNVLLFVMSMLMILTLLTYARLDSYRSQSGLQGEFVRYMQELERTYMNQGEDEAYKAFKVNPKKSDPKSGQTRSSGRINWTPLLYGKSEDPQYAQIFDLSRRLVQFLYQDNMAVQEMLLQRPLYFEEIIGELQRIVPSLQDHYKIKKIQDLGNLQISDGLDAIFYYMLKGCSLPWEAPSSSTAFDVVVEGEDGEDEEEMILGQGQTSLLRYISLRNQSQINVYITSKELLMAIYESQETVENLLNMRFDLYRSTQNKTLTVEQASDELKKHFSSAHFEGLLEYKVTGSNPRDYE
jgi:hypothetical protein